MAKVEQERCATYKGIEVGDGVEELVVHPAKKKKRVTGKN
jgi:hypothetical protein